MIEGHQQIACDEPEKESHECDGGGREAGLCAGE